MARLDGAGVAERGRRRGAARDRRLSGEEGAQPVAPARHRRAAAHAHASSPMPTWTCAAARRGPPSSCSKCSSPARPARQTRRRSRRTRRGLSSPAVPTTFSHPRFRSSATRSRTACGRDGPRPQSRPSWRSPCTTTSVSAPSPKGAPASPTSSSTSCSRARESLPKLEHAKLIQGNGGQFNGSTTPDFTNYFEVVPSGALELVLFLEADRMRSPVITEHTVANQIDVVKEEIRLNIMNRPYGGMQMIYLPRDRVHDVQQHPQRLRQLRRPRVGHRRRRQPTSGSATTRRATPC